MDIQQQIKNRLKKLEGNNPKPIKVKLISGAVQYVLPSNLTWFLNKNKGAKIA